MIVCHCNIITDLEITDVIEVMLAEDAWQLIVPLKVYHALEKRGRCCGCFPQVTSLIISTTQAWHESHATPQAEIINFVERLRAEHNRIEIERVEALAAFNAARKAA
jgi:bacterioferritin-associated ferredoxin